MTTHVSVPTRACLSGEDLDWIEGASVCVALDLPTIASISGGDEDLPDLAFADEIWSFLRQVHSALPLRRPGVHVSTVAPIASGLSTSTSLIIALFKLFITQYQLDERDLPFFAYEFERQIMNGGGMDQLAILTGQVTLFSGTPQGLPLLKETIEWPDQWRVIILDSKSEKSTKSHIEVVRRQQQVGCSKLEEYLCRTSELSMTLWDGITQRHIQDVQASMSKAHELMRDQQGMSTLRLERLRYETSRVAGIDMKITGAGGGGAMVAVVEAGKLDDIVYRLNRIEIEFGCRFLFPSVA